MAKLKKRFDSSKHEDSGFQVAPAGSYLVAIDSDEVKKSTTNKKNSYLNQEFKIVKGKWKGTKFWNMLNLWNQNEQAVSIAESELATQIRAIFGKDKSIPDTKAMFKKPFMVQLGVEEYTTGKGKNKQPKKKNIILGYLSEDSTEKPKEKKGKGKGKKGKDKKKPW